MGQILDIMNGIQQGAEDGRRAGLSRLVGKAYNADPAEQQRLLGLVAQRGEPGMAMQAQKGFDDQAGELHKQLAQRAQMVVQLYKANPQMAQQAYSAMLPLAARAGFPQAQAHPQLDDSLIPGLEKLASALNPPKPQDPYTLSPGSKRFGPDNQLVAEVPFAPASGSIVNVPDGQGGTVQMVFDPKTRQLSEPQYPGQGAPQGQPQPEAAPQTGGASTMLDSSFRGAIDPQAIQTDFRALAQGFPGVQISSLSRTPEHNKEVGGVANSQHIAGTAGDFVVPPEQQPEFIAAAKARGYEVINEGDHIHLELPPGRRAPQQVAQAGRLGYTPPKSATEKAPAGYQWNATHTQMQPIPGGPAEIALAARKDAAAAKQAAEAAKASQKQQVAAARQAEASGAATQLVDAIDGLMASPGFKHLGTVMGDLEVNVPLIRNATKDADAQLKNIAGQVALSTMARLKALSSQGATGFGSLSAPELKLLQNSISTLQSDQISNAQLVTSLANIKRLMQKTATWKGGEAAAPDNASSDAARRALLDKY